MTPQDTATAAPPKRLRVPLNDLPLTPEMAREVEELGRFYGSWARRLRGWLVEEVKLHYYFSGCFVTYLQEPDGKVVVAAPHRDALPLGSILDQLSPDEQRRSCLCFPECRGPDDELLPPLYDGL